MDELTHGRPIGRCALPSCLQKLAVLSNTPHRMPVNRRAWMSVLITDIVLIIA